MLTSFFGPRNAYAFPPLQPREEMGEAVLEEIELDARLKQSIKTLCAWRWMSMVTTDPREVAALLTAEARVLIDLGRQHPSRAKEIGKLIVAYHNLIVRMKRRAGDYESPESAIA